MTNEFCRGHRLSQRKQIIVLKTNWTTRNDSKTYRFEPSGHTVSYCGRLCQELDVYLVDGNTNYRQAPRVVSVRATRADVEAALFAASDD